MPPDVIAQFTVVAYGLLVVAVVLLRAWLAPQGWRLWLLYCLNNLYCRICFGWRANRRCPFQTASPALIIANHRGTVDPLLVWAGVDSMRPIGFMMAQEYYHVPVLHFICRTMESIPVARRGRDMAGIRQALRRLEDGHLLGIFPEGRFNTGPRLLLPGNPGVAWLALKSRAPVYPVFLHNAPPGPSMVLPFLKFRRVRVTYGDPIDLADYYDRPLTNDLLREVIELLMNRIARLSTAADRRS